AEQADGILHRDVLALQTLADLAVANNGVPHAARLTLPEQYQRTITGVTNMLANHRQHEPVGLIRVTIAWLITEGRHPWLGLITFYNGDHLAVVVDMVLDDEQRIRSLKLFPLAQS